MYKRIYLQDFIQRSDFDLRLTTIEYDARMADILNSTFLQQWASKDDCDLILSVDYFQYYVHSSLLFAVCHTLENHVQMIKSSTSIKYICRLSRISPTGLEFILIYFYTSRLILNLSTIVDLIQTASELQIEFVIQRCISFIHRFLLALHSEHELVKSSLHLKILESLYQCSNAQPRIKAVLGLEIRQAMEKFYNEPIDLTVHALRFDRMEEKLEELIDHQYAMLNRFSSLNNSIDHERISNVLICSPSLRTQDQIRQDIDHFCQHIDPSGDKYALIHTGASLYALGSSFFKFDIESHRLDSLDYLHPSFNHYGFAATEQQLVLIGGAIDWNRSTPICSLFDFYLEQWRQLPSISLRKKDGVLLPGLCFIDRSTLICVGGALLTDEGPMAMRKCFLFDLKQNLCSVISSCIEARAKPLVVYHSELIFAIGGLQYRYNRSHIITKINVNSIEQYQILTDQWTMITQLDRLNHSKDLVCTCQGILKGTDEHNNEWSYDLIDGDLTCNLGLSA